MAASRKVLMGAIGHIVLLIINFLVFVGLVESYQILTIELPLLTALVLGYMVIHTTVLLSVQLGIQLLELIRIRMPTLLISYYFLFDDDEAIPLPFLDPVKSRLGVITLLLVISGGPVFYPIFAASGLLFVLAIIAQSLLTLPVLIDYFIQFINWMPPLLVLIVGVAILSIVIIEFKHV
jgi:hypothetical protein